MLRILLLVLALPTVASAQRFGGLPRTFLYNNSSPTVTGLWTFDSDTVLRGSVTGSQFFGDGSALTGLQLSGSRKFKEVDEEITNSTVLQDDDALFASLGAQTTYYVDFDIGYTADANQPDIKIAFSTSTSLQYTMRCHVGEGSTSVEDLPPLSVGDEHVINLTNAVVNSLRCSGRVINNSASAQNMTFRWSQDTSRANATRVLLGSTVFFAEVQ